MLIGQSERAEAFVLRKTLGKHSEQYFESTPANRQTILSFFFAFWFCCFKRDKHRNKVRRLLIKTETKCMIYFIVLLFLFLAIMSMTSSSLLWITNWHQMAEHVKFIFIYLYWPHQKYADKFDFLPFYFCFVLQNETM